jgi:hypothetical protein
MGCSEADLFRGEATTTFADRIAITGRVCAEDAVTTHLPLRVILVADVAQGPLRSSFDPAGLWVDQVTSFSQSAVRRPEVGMAIVGYSGRARKLAPVDPPEASFTALEPALVPGLSSLRLPEPCLPDGRCRDYVEGLRVARGLIEGDLAQLPAGERVLTEYVVLLVVAGSASPMAENVDCCEPDDTRCRSATPVADPDCQAELESAEVAGMIDAVSAAGALGLKLHVLHLAAEEDPAENDRLEDSMRRLAFLAGGSYARVDNIGMLSGAHLDVLDARTSLRFKALYAANMNMKPTPEGSVVDSDGDGLSDVEEERLGTSPVARDSDDDGITDLVESLVDVAEDMPAACRGLVPDDDRDLDGLTDCDEALLGTEPTLADTDGDAMPDLLEVVGLVDYLHRDGEADPDLDGVPNADEVRQRTDARSSDTRHQLSFGYRYDVDDLGVVRELYAQPLIEITGVRLSGVSPDSTAGVGTLRWVAADGTLSWQDASDDAPGVPVPIAEPGEAVLASSSPDRSVRASVENLLDLPAEDTTERVRVIYQEHHCIEYTVRNVRLADAQELAGGEGPGLNRVVLFFAEAPASDLTRPGPFRIAEIPVLFRPPASRTPSGAVLTVLDEEFVRPR